MNELEADASGVDGVDEQFEAFYRAEAAPLMRFLLKLGASIPDAADASGQAFVELYVRWQQVREPRFYLRRVARNELMELARRPQTDTDRAFRACWAADIIEDVYEKHEVQQVMAALRKLPARQQEVMAWHYDGFSAGEVAEVLGIKLNTVYSNLRHAKETLRQLGVGKA